jgi:hypothetical protein
METHLNLVMESTRHAAKAAPDRGVRVRAVESVKLQLLDYFATIGAAPGYMFTIRDFNSQVMMNVYEPVERAALGYALTQLLDAGILRQGSATSYLLTAEGRAMVKAKRRERALGRHIARGSPTSA